MMGRQEDANIYCVTRKEGTVLPVGTAAGTSEHMYSFDYAYNAAPVLELPGGCIIEEHVTTLRHECIAG